MLLELVAGGILVAEYIYHRVTDPGPPSPRDRIEGPQTAGAAMPLFYGRCLIRNPVIAWYGNQTAVQRSSQPDGAFDYTIQIVFVLGIPFFDGLTYLQNIYMGDLKLGKIFPDDQASTLGNPNPSLLFADNSLAVGVDSPELTSMLEAEFGDGNSAQTTVGSSTAGAIALSGVDPTSIPGFRGFATLYAKIERYNPSLPALAVEVSSYPSLLALPSSPGTLTDDPNPVDVLYDLHVAPMNLGMDPALIDLASWQAAAQTLKDEQHGYSRCWSDRPEAPSAIGDVLRQVDGAIDEDPSTGKLRLKLIRADFDPTAIPRITAENCERIENFAAGGWSEVVNKLRVIFTDAENGYREGSATADNQANAFGQDGLEHEMVLQFPGCNTQELADALAARELSARSRPIAKFRAIVDRSFWRTMAGDPIAVTWPEYNISGRIFRVAAVSRGTAEDNTMALDLIEDFFYTHRFETTNTNGLPVHPGGFLG